MSAEVVARMDTSNTSSSSASSANFSVGHHAESTKGEHNKGVLPRQDGETSGNSESFTTTQEHVRKDTLKSSDGLGSSIESRELDGGNKQSPVSVQSVGASKQAIPAISPLTAAAGTHPYSHPPLSAAVTAQNESCATQNPVVQQCSSLTSLGVVASHATAIEQSCSEQGNSLQNQQQELSQSEQPAVTAPTQPLDSVTSRLPVAETKTSESLNFSTGSSSVLGSGTNAGAQKGPLAPRTSSLLISQSSPSQASKVSSNPPIAVIPNRPSAALNPDTKQVTRPRSNSVPTAPSGSGLTSPNPTPNSPAPNPTPNSPAPKPLPQSKQTTALRRGKWTVEEEAYVARVIQDFNSGFLNAPAGTTLRTYLSEKLHCDPMRITKKFTGDACIGKRVFHPAVRCANNAAAIDKAQAELDALERRWRRRLEMQQRESAKKAAASAAAAAAAATGRHHLHVQGANHPTGATISSALYSQIPPAAANSQQLKQSVVTQTASWLDRANAILSTESSSSHDLVGQTESHVPPAEVENQMKDIQLLIHEGPMIQQTSAGLPKLLDKPLQSAQEKTAVCVSTNVVPTNAISSYPVIGTDSKRKVTDDNPAASSVVHQTSTIVPSLSNPPSTQVPQSSGAQHEARHYSHQPEGVQRSASTPNQTLATANISSENNPTENIQWPQDKRPRRSISATQLAPAITADIQTTASAPPSSKPGSSPTIQAAEEEAEALVAFLHSVHASAAASESSNRPPS